MNKYFNLVLIFLCLSLSTMAQDTYRSLKAKGDAAYDNKAYAEATSHYIKAFDLGKPNSGDVYNLACCYALIQDHKNGFKYLNMAIEHGFTNTGWMRGDSDLKYLHQFPEWETIIETCENARVEAESGINQALKNELIKMKDDDQVLRRKAIALMKVPDKKDSLDLIWELVTLEDQKNTKRLKEIVDQHGWPTKSLVGPEASHAAWLLVQHADLDPLFQANTLSMMEPHLQSNEVSAKNYAYLYDRVKTGQGELQRYGTQAADNPITKKTDFLPIEDESKLDARRAEMNITSTSTEYAARMGFNYTPVNQETAAKKQAERDVYYAEQIKLAKTKYLGGWKPQALDAYRAAMRINGSIKNEDLLEASAVAAEFGKDGTDNAYWWLGKLLARNQNMVKEIESDPRFESITGTDRWKTLKQKMDQIK